MADRARTEHAHPAETTPGRRFRRGFRGYRTAVVDESIERLEQRVDDLEHEAVELREALLEAQHHTSETKHDLARAKAELRYWNDRASYVDTEVARARQRAAEVERVARQRAETIEADAQERSLQLVDRVCTEANTMLQHAREEARDMFLRFETDVDMSQQKLEKLEAVRTEVARSMQQALHQFEDAVRELDKVAPARRIVAQLEGPTRRAAPTFGQDRALEAARRFESGVEPQAAASLSTPLTTTTLPAKVQSSASEQNTAAPTPAPTPSAVDKADEEFVSLLVQP